MLQDQLSRNKQCLLELLWTSSHEQSAPLNRDADTSMDIDRSSPRTRQRGLKMSGDLCRMVGGLVVELTTPDVLYNNRFWPEEDSLRVTVERLELLTVQKLYQDSKGREECKGSELGLQHQNLEIGKFDAFKIYFNYSLKEAFFKNYKLHLRFHNTVKS